MAQQRKTGLGRGLSALLNDDSDDLRQPNRNRPQSSSVSAQPERKEEEG